MEILRILADYAGDITCIAALVVMVVRPVRERVFGAAVIREGQMCLLRSEIVRIYYRHLEERQMHQHEYENLCMCYRAYRKLGGNSFVGHIFKEMQEWTVIQ